MPRIGRDSSNSPVASVENTMYRFIAALDERLSNVPLIQVIANLIGLKPGVIVASTVALLSVSLVFGYAGSLICNIIGFFYPAWMTFKAIESEEKEDDRLWLTYWVVYAFFVIVEYFAEWILFWFPMYYLIKVGFLMYLCLPYFRGAEVVYMRLIRPLLIKHQSAIEGAVNNLGVVGNVAAEEVTNILSDGFEFMQNNASRNILFRRPSSSFNTNVD